MARKFRGNSNHCPSVASDEDTDPKVAGSNPLMTIPGQDPASSLTHKHVQGVFLVMLKVLCLFRRVIFVLETFIGSHLNPETGGFCYSM